MVRHLSECRFLCDQLQLPAVGRRCLYDSGGPRGRLQPGFESQRKAAMCNFHLFCSQPLQKQRVSNGTFRIPSGGTATCAHKELTQLFDEKADISGT